MDYSALIVAAGSGSRMGLGYNKLLYTFENGDTIIEKTVEIFRKDERCKQIILVISKEDQATFAHLFQDKSIQFVLGGDTRADSVYNGLKEVREAYVFIHDGARPWLSMECIDRIITKLEEVDACLLMVPVKDTVKEVQNGKITVTLKRSDLRLAQTPQAFLTSLIKASYEKAKNMEIEVTDDASIVELCSDEHVYEVEGSYDNIKVTTKEDLYHHK